MKVGYAIKLYFSWYFPSFKIQVNVLEAYFAIQIDWKFQSKRSYLMKSIALKNSVYSIRKCLPHPISSMYWTQELGALSGTYLGYETVLEAICHLLSTAPWTYTAVVWSILMNECLVRLEFLDRTTYLNLIKQLRRSNFIINTTQ